MTVAVFVQRDVLDLDVPHSCMECGRDRTEGWCARCSEGPDLLEQEGYVFGWSDSNVRYEVVGQLTERALKERRRAQWVKDPSAGD